MASHSSNFKILAQVEVDASGIQEQLTKASQGLKIGGAGQAGQQLGLTFQQANMIMHKSLDIIDSMVDEVYTLDSAMTEFKKVSDLDGSSLDAYIDKLSEIGQTVGRTGAEMTDAATMFRKNSFNDQDSARLAKVAVMYQNVSDTAISAGDSASFIISQLKAFGMEAEDAEGIIDRVNETANNFSVGTNDLSNALELSSAGMATYNNTIEQTIGLIKKLGQVKIP